MNFYCFLDLTVLESFCCSRYWVLRYYLFYIETGLQEAHLRFDASYRFGWSIPQIASVFLLLCTRSVLKYIWVPAFSSILVFSFIPNLYPNLFSRTFMYTYLFLSLFLLTTSPVICLPLYPNVTVTINHHQLLHTSMTRFLGTDASVRPVLSQFSQMVTWWNSGYMRVATSMHGASSGARKILFLSFFSLSLFTFTMLLYK